MQRKFTMDFTLTKQHHREFGYLHTKRSKVWTVILVLMIILMILCVVGAYLRIAQMIVLLPLTVFYYFYWLLNDRYCGWFSYQRRNKKSDGLPAHVTFTEEGVHSDTSLGNGTTFYSAISDVMESEGLFALYISKGSAVLIPKNAFSEGTVEDFRAFLAEKVGAVRYVKPPKRRRLLGILLGVVFTVAMIGAVLLRGYLDNRLMDYSSDPYSIRLPAKFTQTEDGHDFSAYADGVYVYAYSESQEELHSYGIYGLDTVMDYAEDFVTYYNLEEPEFQTLENGTVCVTYTTEFDDAMVYYCDAIVLSDGRFWVTEFYCMESQKEEYADRFLTWATTIQIAKEFV